MKPQHNDAGGGPVPRPPLPGTPDDEHARQQIEALLRQLSDQGHNVEDLVSTSLRNIGLRTFTNTYELGKILGAGGYGNVRRATNIITKKKVAVKIVSTEVKIVGGGVTVQLTPEESRHLRECLKLECALLRELHDKKKHPAILDFIEEFDENGSYYIITELLEGGDLFSRVAHLSKYTEKDARDLIKLLLETMAYVHQRGIIHRDLKLENIMLTNNDDHAHIKVIDFGLAKKAEHITVLEHICGTPSYAAPEVLRGGILYGCEVDIWSMGVICYILLSGRKPFPYNSDRKHEQMHNIRRGNYKFPEERWKSISPEAIDMIKMMLCVNRDERWTATQLLNHPWIKKDSDSLELSDLSFSQMAMRNDLARLRFRKGVNKFIAVNRLTRISEKSRTESQIVIPQHQDDSLVPFAAMALASEHDDEKAVEEEEKKEEEDFR